MLNTNKFYSSVHSPNILFASNEGEEKLVKFQGLRKTPTQREVFRQLRFGWFLCSLSKSCCILLSLQVVSVDPFAPELHLTAS